MELVGGGSVINGAYPIYFLIKGAKSPRTKNLFWGKFCPIEQDFYVSVLLSISVKRFFVSRINIPFFLIDAQPDLE